MSKSLAVIAIGCVAATAAGFAAGSPWLLPVLGAAVAYPFWANELAKGRPGRAVVLALWWALFLSASTAIATAAAPGRAALTIWHGESYASEMIGWVRTGLGAESTPSLFLPQHALHFALFNAACLLSGGFAGLCMGAALLNYMNYYVAVLAMEASRPVLAAALGWPPWALIRVAGFVLAAVPLSAILLSRTRLWSRAQNCRYWKYYVWGLVLVVLDAALKAVLAPHWRVFLLDAL